jgi:AcrR family transcriptional regulator
MAAGFPDSGDPARSMALLWRTPEDSTRRPGPKPALDVDRIVAAAVTLADADGLAAVSMRRVATELGVGAMTLYGHVPGKGELADLMLDAVLAELYPDDAPTGNWRTRLEAVARANWNLFRRHPWAVHLATGRSPLGPSLLRKYELELRAVDGLGLPEVQMDLLVTLVNGFVRGTALGVHEEATTEQVSIDPEHFPTAARVRTVAGGPAADAPHRSFEFGLDRLLDGIGVLILDASR